MFDDKITKLKKDQFIEAESVAYLIKDEQKRKMAFLNTCALFAFKNYIEKNKYNEEAVTNINLFRVPVIAEKYGISDLYIGNIRFDVRVSLDGNVFPIPKCHVKNSFAPDFYVVYRGTKNPLKCEVLGYIKKDDLIFDSQDNEYYYISNSILNPVENLKNEISSFEQKEIKFYETEHKIATENFGALLDGDLDDIKSIDLVEHLLKCTECRSLFVEYSFLEDVLIAVKHYSDLKEEVENKIFEEKTEVNTEDALAGESAVVSQEDISEISLENNDSDTDALSLTDIPEDVIVPEVPVIEPGLISETDDIFSDNLTEELTFDNNQETSESDIIIDDNENGSFTDLSSSEIITDDKSDIFDFDDNLISDEPTVSDNSTEDLVIDSFDEYAIHETDEVNLNEELVIDTKSEEENSEINDFPVNDAEEEILSVDNESSSEEVLSDTDNKIDNISIEQLSSVENAALEGTENKEDDTVENESAEENPAPIPETAFENDFIADIPAETSVFEDETSINLDEGSDENETLTSFIDIPDSEPKKENLSYEQIDNISSVELDIISEEDNDTTSISLEDILVESADIDNETKENLQNDEELQKILGNDEVSDSTNNISSNWNELFTNNTAPSAAAPEKAPEKPAEEVPSYDTETNYDKEEIETLYDENTLQDSEGASIEETIEKTAEKEKKPMNIAVIVALIVVIIATAGGVFFMANKFIPTSDNGSSNNSLSNTLPVNDNSYNADMNRTMTNAFADGNSTLNITKMSWNKNKHATLTPELKEYMNNVAGMIWDELDITLPSVQGYIVEGPAEISIIINKKGEIRDVKIAKSCGAEEVDNVILQSAKKVAEQNQPSMFGVSGENINLTLVVNF